MLEHLDPKKHGAQSSADVGVFLVGAAVGGMIDAGPNAMGFAEPLVVAGLTGAGFLGLKKLILDSPGEGLPPHRTGLTETDKRRSRYRAALVGLKTEIDDAVAEGNDAASGQLRAKLAKLEKIIQLSEHEGLEPEAIEALIDRYR